MGSRRLGALVVLAVLVFARPADAGWLDFIWEMTGPRMIGIGIDCEVGLARKPDKRCLTPLGRIPWPKVDDPDPQDHRFFFASEAFYYLSAPYKSFGWGEVQGVGVDPIVLFSRIRTNSVRLTSGAGFTVQRFWGDGFDAFGNIGLKFRPLGVDVPLPGDLRLNIAYNLRYYWDGFEVIPPAGETPAAFRKVDQAEAVHGITIAIRF